MANLCIGKALMVCTNALFVISGLSAVVLGVLLLADSPRVLLSRLVLAPGGSGASSAFLPPQPLFYYVSLAAMGLGLAICAVAVLGCWASCLHSYCILAVYLFLLSLLLLGELSLGALAALGPQFLGLSVEQHRLVDALQRGYGVPGREQFTAALDLAQVKLNCCGVTAGSDYHSSWWRLRELGQRDLLVPLSCCALDNAAEPDGFLDPKPANLTLCQALQQDAVEPQRHMEGCGHKLALWLSEQLRLLAAAGSALVLVQLWALLATILVCVQLPRCRQKHREQRELCQQSVSVSTRSENGFADFDQSIDKYISREINPEDGDHNAVNLIMTNNNNLLANYSSSVPPVTYPKPTPDSRARFNYNTSSRCFAKDAPDTSVYHISKEITPVIATAIPAQISGPQVYPGKYQVLYHHTDNGAVKYSLPQTRKTQPPARPPRPPPKTYTYEVCGCDLQCYGEVPLATPVAGIGRYQQSCPEPSPYQYVEDLRSSPYQLAMASAIGTSGKRGSRQRLHHAENKLRAISAAEDPVKRVSTPQNRPASRQVKEVIVKSDPAHEKQSQDPAKALDEVA